MKHAALLAWYGLAGTFLCLIQMVGQGLDRWAGPRIDRIINKAERLDRAARRRKA